MNFPKALGIIIALIAFFLIFYFVLLPRKMVKKSEEIGSVYEKLGNQEKLWEWIDKDKK